MKIISSRASLARINACGLDGSALSFRN